MGVQKVQYCCKFCYYFVPFIAGFHRPLRPGGTSNGLHPLATRGSDASSVGPHRADSWGCWTLTRCARVPLCHLLQDPQQCLAARYCLWSCQPTPTGNVKNCHLKKMTCWKICVFFISIKKIFSNDFLLSNFSLSLKWQKLIQGF